MGFLDRFRAGKEDLSVPADWIDSNVWRSWSGPSNIIRGESRYQDDLQEIIGGEARPNGYLLAVEVSLVREPENSYDPNAIRAEVDETQIGYIGKEIAAVYATHLDRVGLSTATFPGIVRGGSEDAPTLGVHIWTTRPIGDAPAIPAEGGMYQIGGWPPPASEGDPDAPPGPPAWHSDPASEKQVGFIQSLISELDPDAPMRYTGASKKLHQQALAIAQPRGDYTNPHSFRHLTKGEATTIIDEFKTL